MSEPGFWSDWSDSSPLFIVNLCSAIHSSVIMLLSGNRSLIKLNPNLDICISNPYRSLNSKLAPRAVKKMDLDELLLKSHLYSHNAIIVLVIFLCMALLDLLIQHQFWRLLIIVNLTICVGLQQ